MRVALSWLQEFAPVTGDAPFIAEQLTDLGLEVGELTVVGEGLGGVVVARVLEVREHPDADKIRLVDVDAGDGEALQIACGASNMVAGDLVPLATVGTVMPNGMEIAARKMRGQMSNGMLCSARELELGDDHDGILVLPAELRPGVPLTEALDLRSDAVFDIDVLPNRPDALSIAGVARDLAARQGVPFHIPTPQVLESGEPAQGADLGRDPGPPTVRPLRRAGAVGHLAGAVAAVDGPTADRCGHAAHQQRRRRVQLRDARARSAQPHL